MFNEISRQAIQQQFLSGNVTAFAQSLKGEDEKVCQAVSEWIATSDQAQLIDCDWNEVLVTLCEKKIESVDLLVSVIVTRHLTSPSSPLLGNVWKALGEFVSTIEGKNAPSLSRLDEQRVIHELISAQFDKSYIEVIRLLSQKTGSALTIEAYAMAKQYNASPEFLEKLCNRDPAIQTVLKRAETINHGRIADCGYSYKELLEVAPLLKNVDLRGTGWKSRMIFRFINQCRLVENLNVTSLPITTFPNSMMNLKILTCSYCQELKNLPNRMPELTILYCNNCPKLPPYNDQIAKLVRTGQLKFNRANSGADYRNYLVFAYPELPDPTRLDDFKRYCFIAGKSFEQESKAILADFLKHAEFVARKFGYVVHKNSSFYTQRFPCWFLEYALTEPKSEVGRHLVPWIKSLPFEKLQYWIKDAIVDFSSPSDWEDYLKRHSHEVSLQFLTQLPRDQSAEQVRRIVENRRFVLEKLCDDMKNRNSAGEYAEQTVSPLSPLAGDEFENLCEAFIELSTQTASILPLPSSVLTTKFPGEATEEWKGLFQNLTLGEFKPLDEDEWSFHPTPNMTQAMVLNRLDGVKSDFFVEALKKGSLLDYALGHFDRDQVPLEALQAYRLGQIPFHEFVTATLLWEALVDFPPQAGIIWESMIYENESCYRVTLSKDQCDKICPFFSVLWSTSGFHQSMIPSPNEKDDGSKSITIYPYSLICKKLQERFGPDAIIPRPVFGFSSKNDIYVNQKEGTRDLGLLFPGIATPIVADNLYIGAGGYAYSIHDISHCAAASFMPLPMREVVFQLVSSLRDQKARVANYVWNITDMDFNSCKGVLENFSWFQKNGKIVPEDQQLSLLMVFLNDAKFTDHLPNLSDAMVTALSDPKQQEFYHKRIGAQGLQTLLDAYRKKK